jgi:hypothetical protein
MNIWLLQGFVIAAAMLLASCGLPSLAGLSGRAAALRGPVQVHTALRIAHLGDVLWHREIVRYSGGLAGAKSPWLKDGDTADMADFSILVGGEEVRVVDPPTEVQGKAVKSVMEKSGVVAGLVGAMDERVTDEWLPILRELTVVGRLRHGGCGWEIGADGKAGLMFSIHDPAGAAMRERLKGWLGIGVSLIGLATLAVTYSRLN